MDPSPFLFLKNISHKLNKLVVYLYHCKFDNKEKVLELGNVDHLLCFRCFLKGSLELSHRLLIQSGGLTSQGMN